MSAKIKSNPPIFPVSRSPIHPLSRVISSLALTVVILISSTLTAASTAKPHAPEPVDMDLIFNKAAPETLEELRLIQDHVYQLAKRVTKSTVGLRIGGAQGSGVIVSADGYVMTAGHVSGAAGRSVIIILHDGRMVKGKTLGANRRIDSGLVKITDKYNKQGDPWPYVGKGHSKSLKQGTWCMAVGHPGGYQPGRTPVVRLGRVLRNNLSAIVTDCTLVGGDSGGPLFDMHGDVIGINSRIGGSLSSNMHVPVDTFRKTWERLAKSQVWGGASKVKSGGPFLGVGGDRDANICKVGQVFPGTPAEKAGFKVGDIIKKFGSVKINNFQELSTQINKRKAGDQVKVEVLRGKDKVIIDLKLGKRP